MKGKRRGGADPVSRAEGVGARAQMRNGAQEFQRVAFLLKRIIRSGWSLHPDFGSVDLKGLFCLWRQHQISGHRKRGTHVLPGDLPEIFHLVLLKDDLDALKTASVVQVDESQRLGITYAAHPSAHRERRIGKSLRIFMQL